MTRHITKLVTALAVAFLTLAALGGVASAHITPVDPTAPAGTYATVELQVPHGCDGQATNKVSVQLRDDISSVTAQSIPGWTVEYERSPLDEPIEDHGQEITEYVSSVSWTATGDPLPDDQFMRFGISMRTPDLAGETLLLPTVQDCVDGSDSAWINADPDSDNPAPSVELVSTDGGHGTASDSADEPASSDDATAEPASTEVAAAAEDEGGGSDGLARTLGVIAIVLAAGAAVIAFQRRS